MILTICLAFAAVFGLGVAVPLVLRALDDRARRAAEWERQVVLKRAAVVHHQRKRVNR